MCNARSTSCVDRDWLAGLRPVQVVNARGYALPHRSAMLPHAASKNRTRGRYGWKAARCIGANCAPPSSNAPRSAVIRKRRYGQFAFFWRQRLPLGYHRFTVEGPGLQRVDAAHRHAERLLIGRQR